MKINIEEFKPFPETNISGKLIINPYWIEHLLNLFSQGYLGEIWEEITETQINLNNQIERIGYGEVGRHFFK